MKALKTLASLALLGCSSLALAAPVEGSDTTMNRLAGLHSEFDSELDGIEHRRGTRRVTSTRRVTVRTSSARPPARPSSRPPSRPSSRPAAIPGHAPRPRGIGRAVFSEGRDVALHFSRRGLRVAHQGGRRVEVQREPGGHEADQDQHDDPDALLTVIRTVGEADAAAR